MDIKQVYFKDMRKIVIDKNTKLWFCSDPHYNHSNLVRGTSNWEDKSRCRNFDTIEEHNQALVDNINAVVDEDDYLVCLGDWSFGGEDKVREFREQLEVNNIILVYGNHDHNIRHKKENQRLFDSVQDYLELEVIDAPTLVHQKKPTKQKIVLSHYPFRTWNWAHHGSWNCYGHVHCTLDAKAPRFPEPTWIGDQYYIKNSKSMDVGFDCHPEFRPFSYHEIKDIMDEREMLFNIDRGI